MRPRRDCSSTEWEQSGLETVALFLEVDISQGDFCDDDHDLMGIEFRTSEKPLPHVMQCSIGLVFVVLSSENLVEWWANSRARRGLDEPSRWRRARK